MTKFDTMEQNFVTLTDEELMNTQGGDFDIAAPIKAIFNVGVEVGKALAKWF